MTDRSDKRPQNDLDKTGEFFNVGAPLHAVRPGYIRRVADDTLFETVSAGHYAYVIAPDRTGKTSLIAATSARLQNNGFNVAIIDLAQIGERDGGTDAGRWYYSIAYRLLRQLRLKTDLQTWWQDHSILSNRQRLVEFYAQIVLPNIAERIVVFVDEIQYVALLQFDEHLLASIRAAHNARSTELEFKRLSFVMVGECDPLSLVDDPQVSPFEVSTEIRLGDFRRKDLDVFAAELNLSAEDAQIALDRIYYWTSGQPYLSQKLARAIARDPFVGEVEQRVDHIVRRQLCGRGAISSEPHLNHLHRVILADRKNFESLLTIYGQVSKGIHIAADEQLPLHRELLAIGLLVIDNDGRFRIRNRVYEQVFTARWANENLPLHWRGPAVAVLLVLVLTAIPFAYTQLLPKPYVSVMSNPTYDLPTVSDAYLNLRSFPGHADAADRMYRSVLEFRARQATSDAMIRDVTRYAADLPEGATIAAEMQSAYWDRAAHTAMRQERRDDALLASLEALQVSTQERRRLSASLIGDDYPRLLRTLPSVPADGLAFNAENNQVTWYTGAEVTQWADAEQGEVVRDPWTIFALEVTPLVRRVIVDQDGVARRIGLTVNVSHPRLDDLRLKLIAPSGRAVELQFADTSSSANEEIRIAATQLGPLVGENLKGTWSLTLRDETTGVTGHLVGWDLSLNSQVLVESFDRGLDIPDPIEQPSENLWFSPDGRYAVARASQSDSARIWDLNFAQAARAIAVPANERVLGLSANAEYLVTVVQNVVNLWRSADGGQHTSLELDASAADILLSADGRHLLVSYRRDLDTRFEVWSLATAAIVSTLTIAGEPAHIAIDAAAEHLAVADYDRAVRVWNLREATQRAQFDLPSQPSRIALSANAASLGVLYGAQGISLWRTDRPDAPLLRESGRNEWHMAFSPSGARFIAGNIREGMQVYRSADGMPVGPLLDTGLRAGGNKTFAFGRGEDVLFMTATGDIARLWSMPAAAPGGSPGVQQARAADHQAWRSTGGVAIALAPGGERLALGDRSGHVHVSEVGANVAALAADSEDVSFIGHRDAVVALAFSTDGALVASIGADGSVRAWDAHSGLPRPYYGRAPLRDPRRIAFSPGGSRLAVLSGTHVWLMDTETGASLADIDLGALHEDLAFISESELFLGGTSGALQSLYADRTGNWHLRTVWQGAQRIQHVEISPGRRQIVIVDAEQRARLLDPADGRVGEQVLALPSPVVDVAFSPNESRVLFRTGRWVHRAIVSPDGLLWTDSVRAPKSLEKTAMTFDRGQSATPARNDDGSGDTVLILTRGTAMPELRELRFNYDEGPALFGARVELLNEWRQKLRGRTISDPDREGF